MIGNVKVSGAGLQKLKDKEKMEKKKAKKEQAKKDWLVNSITRRSSLDFFIFMALEVF